jgi:hypothetical protein
MQIPAWWVCRPWSWPRTVVFHATARERPKPAHLSVQAWLQGEEAKGVVFMNLIYQNLKYFYWITCQDAPFLERRGHHQIPSLLSLE